MTIIRRGLPPLMLTLVLAAVLAVLTPPDTALAAERNCQGYIYTDTAPAGVSIRRGTTSCRTAKRILRTYLTSDAHCEGSACVRRHHGWTCASAAWIARPRLASCSRGRRLIAAYAVYD